VLGVGVLVLVLVLAAVHLAVVLGVASDKVTGVPTPEASILLCTTPSMVVVELFQLVDDQHDLLVTKCLHLVLCN
jgi:hypothetical protein